MALEIQVDPNGEIRNALQRAKTAGVNLTVPFTLISKSWFRANRSIFALSGPGKYPDLGGFNPGAPAWKNSKVTKRTYAKFKKLNEFGFVYPLMRANGRIEDSITNPVGTDSINLIVNKTALYLGTRVPYAIFHQSSAPRTTLPFRPVVFLGVEQTAPTEVRNESTRWVNIIDDYIQQTLNRAFSGSSSGAV